MRNLNILTACILALLVATPIVMGATGDDDLTEVPGATIIYAIVDIVEGFGMTALVIFILLGLLVLFVGLLTHPKATLIGLVVFLIGFAIVVAIWGGRIEIVNKLIKPLGYVMPAKETMLLVFMKPLKHFRR